MEENNLRNDESAIRFLLTEIIAAFNAGDLEKALSLHTENVVLMEANMPAICGKPALRKFFIDFFNQLREQNITAEIAFSILELKVECNMAFVRGEVVLTKRKAGGDPLLVEGKFISLFQKEPDKRWLRSHIVSNTNSPDSRYF